MPLLAIAQPLLAGTFYVDFDAGNDTNPGNTPESPWKHTPGDSAAEGIAKAAKPGPGDTVVFKGGVVYRGSFSAPASGAEGKPLTLDGNTAGLFGKGPAIIDGSEILTGWKRCASADECAGNPNWRNIYVTTLPAGIDPLAANIFEGDRMAWIAQDPNLNDPFYLDDTDTFRKVAAKQVTDTSLVDAASLTQTDPAAWQGAIVVFWGTPNFVYVRDVTGFEPATHTLRFKAVPGVYKDRDSRYALANHLRVLDTPGEVVISESTDQKTRRIYYWPQTPGDIARKTITYSTRATGFNLAGQSHVTLQGFIFQKQGGERVSAATNSGGKAANFLMRDNEIRWLRSRERANAVALTGLQDSLITANNVHENVRCRGLAFNDAVNLTVSENKLHKNGGTGIAFFTCSKSKMLHNTVTGHNGVHANGLTVYVKSDDVLVFGNRVIDSNIAMTTQASSNITIACNLFVGKELYVIADWNNTTGLKILNNTIISQDKPTAVTVGQDTTDIVFKNNITAGQALTRIKNGKPTLANNLYTALAHTQNAKSLEPGALYVPDLAKIFVDPAKGDYRLKSDSPAINAGASVDLQKDLAGAAIPKDAPDIGAYQHRP